MKVSSAAAAAAACSSDGNSVATGRPLRILHVASHLNMRMGGSILAAAQVAETVAGEGWECRVVGTVVAGSGSEEPFPGLFPGVQFQVFPMQFPKHSYHSMALKRWLAAHTAAYDVVHTHGLFNFPYLFGAGAAARAGRPLVVSPHNSLDPYDLRKKALLKRYVYGPWFVRPLLASAATVLCTTPLEAERLVTYGADPRPEVAVIPLPVPVPPPAGPDPAWRAQHDIPADATVILFLSRLDPKKGLNLLIEAFGRVAGADPAAYLVVAGSGDDSVLAEARRLVEVLGLGGRVRWLGFVTGAEKQRAYAGCDLFALTSFNENFGIVVVEALYAGKPVLISREVYLHEMLAPHGCADVCEPTLESVTQALGRLVSDRGHRQALAARAREVAVAAFAPEKVRERLRDVYRQAVLKSGRTRRGAG
ncbi:MAG: glycosyltransferase [Verrucomicrobiae bacterium]|nr:glycosyltransferase [Verrucomicrobiae bacterium]